MKIALLLSLGLMVAGCIPKADASAEMNAPKAEGSKPTDETPTTDILGGCKASGLERYVGKTFTPQLGEEMKKTAGAMMVRVAHENGMITMDYNSGRLNIFHNDAKVIVRVDCG